MSNAAAEIPDVPGPGVDVPGPDVTEPGVTVHRSLSPSRAGDFMTCPLLYRFRVIDRLPEPPSPAAARGTLGHAVLERLFDPPAAERTPASARALRAPGWDRRVTGEPELASLFAAEADLAAWLGEAGVMLDRYFSLEDAGRPERPHR